MKRFWLILLLFAVSPVAARDIPEWITANLHRECAAADKDDDAVLIYGHTTVSEKNGTIITREQRIYRIVRLEGLSYSRLEINAVKDDKVKNITGYRFDGDGNFLEKLKRKNIRRTAFNDSFHDDHRQVSASFDNFQAGEIAAFEYEIRHHILFPQHLITFRGSAAVGFRQVELAGNGSATVLNDPGHTIRRNGMVFTMENQPALKDESYDPPLRERIPLLGISYDRNPDRSWESISRRYARKTMKIGGLNTSMDPDIGNLLAISDPEEFILKTLQYVSHSVRYIAIEVGEGRLIPHPPSLVNERKYGDCKDMAFYARAILQAGHVTAFPVLARLKRFGPVFDSFPAFQFNHAIIAVKLDDRTTKLENFRIADEPYLIADLTDKFTQPPQINADLENTRILLATPEGSPLSTLPAGPADANVKTENIYVILRRDRSVDITLEERLTGHYAAHEFARRESLDKQKQGEIQRKWVQALIPGAELREMHLADEAGEAVTRTSFTADRLGTEIDGKYYFGPDFIDAHSRVFRKRKRESDVVLPFIGCRRLNFQIAVDPALRILAVPKAGTMDTPYFTADIQADEKPANTVEMHVNFRWKTDRIPVKEYPEFRKLYRKFLKSAKSQIVLI